MSQLGTVYATKRRRRNGKSLKPPPKDGVTKSNPSKRHRERLNAELDLLASLLPFEQNILSKLDRLSILRLSVSYLRTKSYFQVVMHKEKDENGMLSHVHSHDAYRSRELGVLEHSLLDGDMFLQALNGFLMILTCEGEVFFATHSIESYLGFHQSDIVHQSVYELVHSEDREELQRQLLWNSFLPQDLTGMPLAEALTTDKCHFLERSFTVRFRCLLDNTSGFLRLDIRGRVKILHGQNRKTEEPPLALFAYCTPFGPPSLLELPQKENMFKSKHKLDLSLVSMDQRGKLIFGYSDTEFGSMGGYDLVHFDDLAYVASAHQELLKTGASGMIAYRFQKKDGEWQWLQTSSRLVYKNSKPDFVICTHRQLMEEEGRDLLGKRTMDFKVSYLDTGLSSTYFSDADQIVIPPTGSPNSLPPPAPVTPQRTNRRYKTQLRDFLSTCQRSKRKNQAQNNVGQVTPPTPSVVEYIPDPAVAVAAAYSNLNPMYSPSPYAPTAENIYMTSSVHSANFYPVTENIFHQYRLQGVGGYYSEYHHHHGGASSPYVTTNGFLSYDNYGIPTKEEKWQDNSAKYYQTTDPIISTNRGHVYSGYGSPTATPSQIISGSLKTPKSSPSLMDSSSNHISSGGPSPINSNLVSNNSPSSNSATNGQNHHEIINVTPKVEHSPNSDVHYEPQRQTVLMWGAAQNTPAPTRPTSTPIPASVPTPSSTRSPNTTPTSNGIYQPPGVDSHLKHNGRMGGNIIMSPSLEDSSHQMQLASHQLNVQIVPQQHQMIHHQQPHHLQTQANHLKWNGSHKDLSNTSGFSVHHQDPMESYAHLPPNTTSSSSSSVTASDIGIVGNHSHQMQQQQIGGSGGSNSCEVWSPASSYSQNQYFTYHNAPQHASTQSHLGDSIPATIRSSSSSSAISNGYIMDSHSHHPGSMGHPPPLHPGVASIPPLPPPPPPSLSSNSTLSSHSPTSPHSHPHHHQHRTSTLTSTRTGVLCCPSLR